MKKILVFVFSLALILPAINVKAEEALPGTLIKASTPAVYYYSSDGKRYVFPNEKTYKTWYSDFSSVQTVSDSFLASIMIGGNVTYRPGIKMVKVDTDPRVYAVSKGGALRWVKTEAAAIGLYGLDWNKKIDDIPDAFFVNYTAGSVIENVADFNAVTETEAVLNIDANKLTAVPVAPIAPTEPTYSWNTKTIQADSYTHKNLDWSYYNGGFLASWSDDRNGQNEVFYQKTGIDGAAIGDSVKITSNITDSVNAKIGYDGANTYFIWEDFSVLKRAIYLQKYDSDWVKYTQSLFASSTYATSRFPDIAWNSGLGEFGVSWWDTKSTLTGSVGDIYFVKMKDGRKNGSELKLSSGAVLETTPKIIAVGNKFAILWQDGDNSVKLAFVDQYGAQSGTTKNLFTASKAVQAKIAWNGTNFAVAWADENSVYFMLLDENGNTKVEKTLLASGSEPDVIWTGDKFYVGYSKDSDIFVAKITVAGSIYGSEKNISNTAEASSSPRLAINGSSILAVWLEESGTVNKIIAASETKQ
ncbi:MAG: hypothetical protein WC459_02805 [Patescibacteria group bacterium]